MYPRTYSSEWDFKNVNTKEYTHGYHNYPAMMIPQIARKLLNEYRPEGHFGLLFDPYMGSGTSLVEASVQGIDSIGTDINPLACLIAEVKTTRYDANRLKEFLQFLTERLETYDPRLQGEYCYDHITKADYWYSAENLAKLRFLTDLIDAHADRSFVNFFRLALSEVIRESSYTRNGEFKRYRIAPSKISKFDVDPFKLFIRKVQRNLGGLSAYSTVAHPGRTVVSNFNTIDGIPQRIFKGRKADMVITSPPYGDSKTTVAYGQFSRWTNEWFQFENAQKIDSLLMGGQLKTEFSFRTETIARELEQIKEVDRRRYVEVMTFLDDYHRSIAHVSSVVRSGGRVCSSEKTTFTLPRRRLRHSRRMTLASGSTVVFSMSATRNAVGSSLLAAPMLHRIGTPSFLQQRISSSLALTVSMQSST
mgnify:FL=1